MPAFQAFRNCLQMVSVASEHPELVNAPYAAMGFSTGVFGVRTRQTILASTLSAHAEFWFPFAKHEALWQFRFMGKASRAKRRARELQRQRAATQQALVGRVQQSLPDERIKFVKRRTGPKVSDVLMEFAEPWLDEARNDDQRKIVIGMAVLAWNMAAIPEPDRWEGVSPEFAETLREPGKAILKEMIARKLALYSEQDRALLDYEITGSDPNLRVDVVYSLSPEEMADLKKSEQGLEAC